MPDTTPQIIQLSLNRPEAAACAGLMTYGIFFLKQPPLQLIARMLDQELMASAARLVINRTGNIDVYQMSDSELMDELHTALQSGSATVSAIIKALHPEAKMGDYPSPHRP